MRKDWGLIPKILDGRKNIESRWGINKCSPWGKVKAGDIIYFKNSGEPVTVIAKVSKIKQFENLNSQKVRELLEKYGGDDGIAVADLESTIGWAKEKRYCTLIYLKNPKKVKPFNIDKRGFGMSAAWLSVNKIGSIKKAI
jgi:ASC-1-like (ASCH) protein